MSTIQIASGRRDMRDHIGRLNWLLILLLSLIATAGVLTLYSVADGSWSPWALRHATRFSIALMLMIGMGFIAIRYWMALSYPIYFAALIALILVPIMGEVNGGARRWIELAGVQFQPSEAMKIGLVMALARYYHGLRLEQVSHIAYLIPPALMIGAPVALVLQQPDLGTALLLAASGGTVVILAGLSWRIVFLGVLGAGAAGYAAYRFEFLQPYQLQRIFTFLEPDRDPTGEGYQLLQSKIGIGSGGLTGKGYMNSTQSELDFLPEMQTDFIFIILGEEFGFVGAAFLLFAYLWVIREGLGIAMRARSHFARLTTMGVVVTFALYVLINTGMVIGLAPVVGVPLPLVSYGGTVMLTIMAGFGLVMSAHLSKENDGPFV